MAKFIPKTVTDVVDPLKGMLTRLMLDIDGISYENDSNCVSCLMILASATVTTISLSMKIPPAGLHLIDESDTHDDRSQSVPPKRTLGLVSTM